MYYDKKYLIRRLIRELSIIIAIIILVHLLTILCININSLKSITEGEVIKKDFSPAHSQIMNLPVVTTNGTITYTTLIPYVYHYPDTYKITVKNNTINNKEMTKTFRVIKEVYDAVNEGDYFVYDKNFKPDEPEYTKERQNSEE